jgi:toxin-antitoxin system PIN domain toxin
LKLLDSNVWLALAIPAHSHYSRATDWFLRQDGDAGVLFCRSTQQSVLRLLTTKAVLNAFGSTPLTNQQAWEVYGSLRDNPRVGFCDEDDRLQETWRQLSTKATASPKVWMDAYLAALAISSGHQLVTTDQDFRQFRGLDLMLL